MGFGLAEGVLVFSDPTQIRDLRRVCLYWVGGVCCVV